jgi:hypothetical protein
MITYCSKCGIANRLGDERCQACEGRLRKPTAEELAAPRTAFTNPTAEPAYVLAERNRWARIASRSMLSAALISLSRATLMPFLITHAPRGTFGRIDPAVVQEHGYLAAVGFTIAAIWCQRDPLFSSVAALSVYLGFAIPDALDGTTLLSRGIISKSIMMLVLLRALNAAIRHRTTRHDPAIAAYEA